MAFPPPKQKKNTQRFRAKKERERFQTDKLGSYNINKTFTALSQATNNFFFLFFI